MLATANLGPVPPRPRAFHIALWIAQIAIAATLATAAYSRISHSMGAMPSDLSRLVGYFELAGAVAMIHPSLLRVLPQLTPLAAAAMALIELLAIPLHLSIGRVDLLPTNLALLAAASFVAWGRWRKAPIPSRWSTANVGLNIN